MLWKTKNRSFDLRSRGMIMGILNLTVDSFSDGGQFLDLEAAVAHALEMEAQGADIIDIGGESTRPGAQPVPVEEELARVVPVVEALRGRLGALISIDTYKATVAEAAILAGAEVVNDISALEGDPRMAEVVARSGVGVVLMHKKGTPATMQVAPQYDNVLTEVRDFFERSKERALRAGIEIEKIVFDPGIGFGKTVEHNLALIRNLEKLRVEGRPLLLGVSRKSFIGKVLNSMEIEDRSWPTVAMTSLGRELGAEIFRVHEVKPNREALRMTEAILQC